ncbi:PQQ-dependent sugar dehydrogenase [Salinimicrobium oceani]|uniref:PQQ-dependent sugar dehydrogenase n=1 Tax=Salinimicrobium oceani TaxID=2722702 RepID=A0ABX1CTI0_9FLAO|nr:PQQ-dependent sugar dehydrogenase [Salinimicrobium oceani]NJW51589.1 PQQ-dependent sugar dehydrogenase [Salinimicrobium oceani]
MKIRILLVPVFAAAFVIGCGENEKAKAEVDQQATENDSIQETVSVTIPEEQLTTAEYEFEVVVPDLQIAWGLDFLPDGSMLITEKSGELIHYKDEKKQQVKASPEVYNRGQGGFLDVAVGPDFKNDGWIYFTYASTEGEGEGGNTTLMRAKLENNQLTNKEVLYKAVPNSTRGQHFGSRISFDGQGHLFFSVGDRGDRDVNPQDLTRDGGKVYRLNLDGSIPQDNPFVGEAGAKEAVFSYGHRNPQGMIFNKETGEVWVHEHGPQGGDEINVIKKGANYGWPLVSYGINYDGTSFTDETAGPDFEDPLYYWVPSIAPSGFVFVTSDKYPELKGDVLVGSLKFQYVEHLSLNGKEVTAREKILEQIGRVRDIVESPDGDLYVSVEGIGIVKILPKQ